MVDITQPLLSLQVRRPYRGQSTRAHAESAPSKGGVPTAYHLTVAAVHAAAQPGQLHTAASAARAAEQDWRRISGSYVGATAPGSGRLAVHQLRCSRQTRRSDGHPTCLPNASKVLACLQICNPLLRSKQRLLIALDTTYSSCTCPRSHIPDAAQPVPLRCIAGVALSVRVASIPAMPPSPALAPTPQRLALPVSAFAAATAVTDGETVHPPPASVDELQADKGPPSSAGAPDAESLDGALSAVTVRQA